MKEYRKPEITILRFLSKDPISSNLQDWLNEREFQDAGISAYSITSLGE